MIELLIFSIIGVIIVSKQFQTIKKLDKLEKRTTCKYEIIYYMLKDVLAEHRQQKGE